MSSTPQENVVAHQIVDAAFKIHSTLGPGLLESVYEAVLAHELRQRGLLVQCQVPIAVNYERLRFDVGFRADMVVNDLVLVELKSVEHEAPVHKKQTLTYVRLARLRLGILINFGQRRVKDGITRLANGLPDHDLGALAASRDSCGAPGSAMAINPGHPV
jgi:GxxExxY protein